MARRRCRRWRSRTKGFDRTKYRGCAVTSIGFGNNIGGNLISQTGRGVLTACQTASFNLLGKGIGDFNELIGGPSGANAGYDYLPQLINCAYSAGVPSLESRTKKSRCASANIISTLETRSSCAFSYKLGHKAGVGIWVVGSNDLAGDLLDKVESIETIRSTSVKCGLTDIGLVSGALQPPIRSFKHIIRSVDSFLNLRLASNRSRIHGRFNGVPG